jgi:hypothetical protein
MDGADESTMADNDSRDEAEKGGLSDRMRRLIEIATLEERRKAITEKGSGPDGEQRRRTDVSGEPDERAS